jgi:hypothetical protein
MLRRKLHYRALSRLVAGLFAVQLLAAGFCLIMPQAHAMPIANAADSACDKMEVAEHCTPSVQTGMSHDAGDASCSLCDQPDLVMQSISVPAEIDLVMLLYSTAANDLFDWVIRSISLFSRTPDGPPKSSALLYLISPRIRV